LPGNCTTTTWTAWTRAWTRHDCVAQEPKRVWISRGR
jgi:hypothetical protein